MECHQGQLTGGSEKGNGALHIGSWERLHDKLVDLTLADSVLRSLRYGIGIAAEAWWLRYFVPSQSTYLVWGVGRGSFHRALVLKYCTFYDEIIWYRYAWINHQTKAHGPQMGISFKFLPRVGDWCYLIAPQDT